MKIWIVQQGFSMGSLGTVYGAFPTEAEAEAFTASVSADLTDHVTVHSAPVMRFLPAEEKPLAEPEKVEMLGITPRPDRPRVPRHPGDVYGDDSPF